MTQLPFSLAQKILLQTTHQVRRRAYEIYLERDRHASDALGDWLRAERELQKIALFARDWNRHQDYVAPLPNVEIAVPNAEERKTSSR